VTVFSIYF